VKKPEDAAIAAKRLLKSLSETYFMGPHNLHITSSIGVSMYPDDGPDAETLIKNADTAMYQAKENGRQSFQFFKPEMNVRAVERQSIEEDLSRFRKFGQRDKWKGCSLTAIKMAETRSNDDTTSTAESHSNLQSEGGPCRAEGG
jgi:hypothetical protein